MDKPHGFWVHTCRNLATHFLDIIDYMSMKCDEIHVIYDRYDIKIISNRELAEIFKEATDQWCNIYPNWLWSNTIKCI